MANFSKTITYHIGVPAGFFSREAFDREWINTIKILVVSKIIVLLEGLSNTFREFISSVRGR